MWGAVAVESDSDLTGSFTLASTLLLIGVLSSWLYLKTNQAGLTLDIPEFQALTVTSNQVADLDLLAETPLEQAEVAFAAGRIVAPEADNALYYYQQALANDNQVDALAAQQGIDRVVAYLLNTGESALYNNDWGAAQAAARRVLAAVPGHGVASELLSRAARVEQVDALSQQALRLLAQGNLVEGDDHALQTYQTILTLDPNSAVAQRGIETIAQRLLGHAQTAGFAGDHAQAQALIAQVKAFAPAAQGLAETEALSAQWQKLVEDKATQNRLLAASEALQANRLIPPAENNALDQFQAVLAVDPESAAARRGIALVGEALIDRASALLLDESVTLQDLGIAQQMINRATEIDADDAAIARVNQQISAINEELVYQQRLADARAGKFEQITRISELQPIRRRLPEYPRALAERELTGFSALEFTVTMDGEITDATIAESTHELFDNAALEAIANWRFKPFVENGRPVPVRTAVRFTFQP